jgi:hypothetical protein
MNEWMQAEAAQAGIKFPTNGIVEGIYFRQANTRRGDYS